MKIRKYLLAFVVTGSMSAYLLAQPPGGFPGGGGQPGMGGPGGGGRGFGGGGGGRPDSEMIWTMMGGAGKDAINLNDPANARIRDRMVQRGQAIPPNGMLTKAEFKANMDKAMNGGGGMGGPQGMGGAPGASTMTFQVGPNGQPVQVQNTPGSSTTNQMNSESQGRMGRGGEFGGRGGDRGFGGGGGDRGGGGGFNGGMPPGGGWGGPPPSFGAESGNWPKRNKDKEKDEEDEKVAVYRFGGYTPKGAPGWFEQLDTDKDGQIGLYEWKAAGRKIEDFVEFDLNADGYVTTEEWLRKQNMDIANREIEERQNGGTVNTSSGSGSGRGGWGGGSGGPGSGGSGGGNWGGSRGPSPSSTDSGSSKPNPFTSGGSKDRGGRVEKPKN